MADIELRINAKSVDDLHDALTRLLTGNKFMSPADEPERPEAGATQDAEPGERKRRGRPPKTPDTSSESAPSQPSTGAAKDPFGDQIKQAAAEDGASGEVTLQMVRSALAAVVEKGASPPKLKEEVFAKVGAQSIGSTDPARFPELLKLLQDYQP